MANREIGEVTLEAGGTTYRLLLSTAAMVALEEVYSTPTHEATFEEAWSKATGGSVRGLRKLLWAMTREHHPELTEADMNRVIDGVGGLVGLTNVLQVAQASAGADPEDEKELRGSGKGNPRKAQPKHARRNGDPFTSMRGASA